MRDLLFTPLQAGALSLPNRVVMAPMTRSRALDDGTVPSMTADYYAQRASAGLILTEGLFPEAMGKGYVRTPGLANDEQAASWARVTRAVHAAGGRIAAQLMHVGRISDPLFLPHGSTPVAPSAVRPHGSSYTDVGPRPHITPRALERAEIKRIVNAFAAATERALEAGFDAVELHAGSGYLPMQFLSSRTNHRLDEYGGDALARSRFLLEVLDAMVAIADAGRVGLKLTPELPFNDIADDTPEHTYTTLMREVAKRDIAFVEVVSTGPVDWHSLLRPLFKGAYFLGGGQTGDSALEHVQAGRADAAVFGQAFIANPDLPLRLLAGAPLASADRDTFYSPGPQGYVDYPVWANADALALA
ncbi:alkene reductase [Piscinibacter sp. HJYY11]|uniref:alkene reductase n=1 Tax=Piscinibacter sp. HJYY11 TaxID=2801333 RepID=UPI00191CD0C1|nr:alkene reductase [Piscinibacter sp. HJYY11]MBL0729415.1 alkene reductase [Piscinibacter sp. HJYY11]